MEQNELFEQSFNYEAKDIVAGRVLLSEPFMVDANFARSVVLMCEHTKKHGTVGFIVNKPLNMQLTEVMDDIGSFNAQLHYGGPVETDTLHFMHTIGPSIEGSLEVLPNMFWGGNFEQLKALLSEGKVAKHQVRFFLGYAGWGAGQLLAELKTKSWVISKAGIGEVFTPDPKSLWKKVLYSMGGVYKIMANAPVTPSLN